MAIYENIKLDKGLYSTGKGFTAELESVDPPRITRVPLLTVLTHLKDSLSVLTSR